jgi:hypothetical protein
MWQIQGIVWIEIVLTCDSKNLAKLIGFLFTSITRDIACHPLSLYYLNSSGWWYKKGAIYRCFTVCRFALTFVFAITIIHPSCTCHGRSTSSTSVQCVKKAGNSRDVTLTLILNSSFCFCFCHMIASFIILKIMQFWFLCGMPNE